MNESTKTLMCTIIIVIVSVCAVTGAVVIAKGIKHEIDNYIWNHSDHTKTLESCNDYYTENNSSIPYYQHYCWTGN